MPAIEAADAVRASKCGLDFRFRLNFSPNNSILFPEATLISPTATSGQLVPVPTQSVWVLSGFKAR